MKKLLQVTLLGLLLSTTQVSFAYEIAQDIQLKRADIKRIKILSSETDSIVVFVTDNQENKYRIAFVPKNEVDQMLEQLKTDEGITLRSRSVDKKDFREVMAWK